MIKRMINLFIVMLLLLMPALSFGAETTKVRFVGSIYADSKGGAIKIPEGVACSYKSLVVVSDTGGNRLLKYTFTDGVLQGGEELPVTGMSNPLRIQMNSKGEIFVLDGKQRRIVRISPDGGPAAYVTPQGLATPADFVPRSFKVDASDAIYVLDILNARVLVLDPSGKFMKSLPFPEGYGFISDLAVDAQGTIYLIDSTTSTVYTAGKDAQAFTALTKSLKENIAFAADITIDSKGTIFLSDQDNSSIVTLNRDGSYQARLLSQGWKEGFLHYPTQMCITNSGNLFIADRDNSRIEIFSIVQ